MFGTGILALSFANSQCQIVASDMIGRCDAKAHFVGLYRIIIIFSTPLFTVALKKLGVLQVSLGQVAGMTTFARG